MARAARILFFAVLVAFFAATMYFGVRESLGPTGMASSSFAASAIINGAAANLSNATQSGAVSAGSADARLSSNIDYSGSGTTIITVPAPVGIVDPYDWYVMEDGVRRAVTQNGTNLSWTANLNAGTATLYFSVPAPEIETLSVSVSTTQYEGRYTVSADNHFTDVTTRIPLSRSIDGARLYLLEGNDSHDVTNNYSLRVSGTTAVWSGFSLSEKTFLLRGDVVAGGRNVYIPPDDEPVYVPLFAVDQEEITVREGMPLIFHVVNADDEPATLAVRSSDSAFAVPSEVTVPPNGSAEVAVEFSGGAPGEYTTEIEVSDGTTTRSVSVTVTVPARKTPVKKESPRPLAETSQLEFPAAALSPWTPVIPLNLALLFIAAALAAVIVFMRGPGTPKTPQV